MKRECLFAIFVIAIFSLPNSFAFLSNDQKYDLKQIAQLSMFLWTIDAVNNNLYSGTYGDPQLFFYSGYPYTNWARTIISSGDEATRVYNLNGRFFSLTEGGVVYADNRKCYDFGQYYLLYAVYYNNMNLISISPDSSGPDHSELYNCPCSGVTSCVKVKSVNIPYVFKMLNYNGGLILSGSGNDYRSGTSGKISFMSPSGVVSPLITTGYGTIGESEVFNGRVYFMSNDADGARIFSYDGARFKNEYKQYGEFRRGELEAFDGKLFATITGNPGYLIILYLDSDDSWKMAFDGRTNQNMRAYGQNGGLTAGSMKSLNGKLYISINTPIGNRIGPGFILEMSKVITDGSCDTFWSNIEWKALNNSLGFTTPDNPNKRFLCYNSNLYECGWEYDVPTFAQKAIDGSMVAKWKCNLSQKTWIDTTLPVQPTQSQQQEALAPTVINDNSPVNNSSSEILFTVNDKDFDNIQDIYDRCNSTPSGQAVNYQGCIIPNFTSFDENSTNLYYSDLNNLKNFTLSKSEGKIVFQNDVSLTRDFPVIDLNSNVLIEKNKVTIYTTLLPELNKPAIITLRNVNISNPMVLRDGQNCTDCQILSYQNGEVTFSVPHFTTYEVVESNSTNFNQNNSFNLTNQTQNQVQNQTDLTQRYNYSYSRNQTNINNYRTNISNSSNAEQKTNFLFFFIILFVILLIFIGAIAYFFLKKSPNKENSVLKNEDLQTQKSSSINPVLYSRKQFDNGFRLDFKK